MLRPRARPFTPGDWYWFIAEDATRAWSSRAQDFVAEVPDGAGVTRIDSIENLCDVLRKYGLAVPQPTPADYASEIDAVVEATAQERGYSSAVSLASYTASGNTAWKQEAETFISWRDAVWGYALARLAAVQSGQQQQPTVAAFLDGMPQIIWPQGS